jgi:hypothetical protein
VEHQFLLLLKDILTHTYENVIPQISDQLSRPESNRRCKRIMQLLRGSERDLKLDIPGVEYAAHTMENGGEDRAESLPAVPPQPAIKVITLF